MRNLTAADALYPPTVKPSVRSLPLLPFIARFVRNPLRSLPHAGWAAAFLAANLVYIPLLEEPALVGRFGEPYREYCRNVPRIFPRLPPWEP